MYPNGRFVLRVGKRILNPEPADQVYEFRRWPFIVGVNQALPHAWQGLNAVEMPRGLQDWVNVSVAHLANYVKFFGDPIVMVEQGAIAADPENRKITEKIRAKAGDLWKLAVGGIAKIKREPPVPMPAGTLQIWDAMKAELKDQTGTQDVGIGRQTKGSPTAYEISQLARNSQARTAMAAVYQDAWMAEVMGLAAEMDQKYLAVGDSVRIVGEGQRTAAAAIAAGACEAHFDVAMKITQALPFDRERMRQEAKELFGEIGPAYLPELLEAYGVKNKDAVLARVTEYQAFLAWQKQMEAAGAGGAGGAPAAQPPATAGEAPIEEIIAAATPPAAAGGEAPVEEVAAAAGEP